MGQSGNQGGRGSWAALIRSPRGAKPCPQESGAWHLFLLVESRVAWRQGFLSLSLPVCQVVSVAFVSVEPGPLHTECYQPKTLCYLEAQMEWFLTWEGNTVWLTEREMWVRKLFTTSPR